MSAMRSFEQQHGNTVENINNRILDRKTTEMLTIVL